MTDGAEGYSIADGLPKLVIGAGRSQAVLNDLADFISEVGNVFRQGDGPNLRGVIVQEMPEKRRKELARRKVSVPQGLLLPEVLNDSHLQDLAEQAFLCVRLWVNPKTKEAQELPADFPVGLARRLIQARLGTLRPLRGIAYTPLLRADGTIVQVAGYDEATELWIVADAPSFSLPDRPTKEDAEAYYGTLVELVDEHPFETDEDKIAGVGLLMTPALRASMQRVPLLVAEAPYGRTGKDFLLGTAALIGTGRAPVVVSLSESREEQQKRIGHALLLGAPSVNLNNINGTLRSDELASYLTEGGCVTRSYGTVGGAKFAPNGNTIMASGNNFIPGGDLPERLFGSRQDARMEFPGARTFKHDPHRMVLEDRGKYLRAVFGIARWVIRGDDYRQPDIGGLGGFDQFNHLVRAPLLALTGKDPLRRAEQQLVASRQQRSERPLIDALALLFKVEEAFCTRNVTAKLKTKAVDRGEDDPWAPLRLDQTALGYRLRRAIGQRGTAVQLATAEKPQGGADVAFYQLLALQRPATSAGSTESAGSSPIYTSSFRDELSRMGGKSAESAAPQKSPSDETLI